jgi:hypothetical protein
MYIFLKDCELIECKTAFEVAYWFDIRIDEKGILTFEGKQDTVSYNMKEFTKEEAIVEFVLHRLKKFVKIYKAELL